MFSSAQASSYSGSFTVLAFQRTEPKFGLLYVLFFESLRSYFLETQTQREMYLVSQTHRGLLGRYECLAMFVLESFLVKFETFYQKKDMYIFRKVNRVDSFTI